MTSFNLSFAARGAAAFAATLMTLAFISSVVTNVYGA